MLSQNDGVRRQAVGNVSSQGFLFADRDAVYIVPRGTVIDVSWLDARAAWARKELAKLRRRKLSVERDDEICIMADLVEAANLCAEWMRAAGETSRRCVGPFSPALSMSGDSVRVKAGAEIFAQDDALGLVKTRANRSCTVTVLHSYRGYIDKSRRSNGGGSIVVQPRIEWGGKNGPLKWTDANNAN